MDISFSFAQLLGPVFLIGGLGILLNLDKAKKMVGELEKNFTLLWVMAFFLMIFAMAIVLSHNVWEWSWKLIITIIGWGSLVKGALFMLIPDKFLEFSKGATKCKYCYPFGGALWLIFGAVLCYFGFFA